MKEASLRSMVPELIRPFLPVIFEKPAPSERKATCDSCTMCPPEGAPSSDHVTYFRPDTKCCTFHPLLPNYLVGAILADERPDMAEGKRRIQEKIKNRIGVSPQWLAPPRKTSILMAAAWRNAFGRSLALVCPYFDRTGLGCTIWRHRDSVCSTFFCKYEAGADGESFWKALNRYGVGIENTLSVAAARSLIAGHSEPKPHSEPMTLEELEDRPMEHKKYSALWREWVGREEGFYVRCFEHVRGLTNADFDALFAGTDQSAKLEQLSQAYETMLSPKLPPTLVPNPEMTSHKTEGGVLVSSYSRYEPLLLTEDLFEVIRAFGDGGTVAEVRERVHKEHGAELPEEIILGLYRFRVLVVPVATEPDRAMP